MKLPAKYRNIFLTVAAILLLFALIFYRTDGKKSGKREKISTALLNPKYRENLSRIELNGAEGTIILLKNREIWTVKSDDAEYEMPANQKTVLDFTSDLSKIVNLHKVSELSKSNFRTFFPDEISFSVKYTVAEKSTVLYFGKYDFSQDFRYMMSDKNTNIYEINDSLDKYLNTSFQVWAEPNLISQNIIGKISAQDIQRIIFSFDEESLQYGSKKMRRSVAISSESENFDTTKRKLLELRHGGRLAKNIPIEENPELTVKIELGNKSDVILNFHLPKQDYGENAQDKEIFYVVKAIYNSSGKKNPSDENSLHDSDDTSDSTLTEEFTGRISGWTYSKIREMML